MGRGALSLERDQQEQEDLRPEKHSSTAVLVGRLHRPILLPVEQRLCWEWKDPVSHLVPPALFLLVKSPEVNALESGLPEAPPRQRLWHVLESHSGEYLPLELLHYHRKHG